MSSFSIVLVLVSFQVFCDGAHAPGRVGYPLHRRSGFPLVRPGEFRVEKRTAVQQSSCLQAHNDKRALHEGTSSLVWDASLAQQAQKWADHLLALGEMQHSGTAGQGENLYWGIGSTAASCADAVEAWYAEIADYDFNNPAFAYNTGHFTQVVWKGTTNVGVGIASKKLTSGDYVGMYETYVVARFTPPGNYQGEFAENVGDVV
ncbi:sterol-binding protein [Desmophyllum pertusum]|uniref:Sterol-binding protein n=1 Tax=Desmophyllum pertusum TaxID=174260 RepID=A0A9W9ZHZ1_9CNID|nr:sterol-binding protein [Desmophyllum pertusum]